MAPTVLAARQAERALKHRSLAKELVELDRAAAEAAARLVPQRARSSAAVARARAALENAIAAGKRDPA